MKRKLMFFLMLIIISFSVNAQIYEDDFDIKDDTSKDNTFIGSIDNLIEIQISGIVSKDIPSVAKAGETVKLIGILEEKKNSYSIVANVKGANKTFSVKYIDRIDLKYTNPREFWVYKMLNFNLDYFTSEMQYDIRKEVADESLEYQRNVHEYNWALEDDYLESYLHQLLYKLYPQKIDSRRHEQLKATIIKNHQPNAYIFANGALYITTGMLSSINSEEELIAILAHEVAHYVLDHSIYNINQKAKREKRAEFWTGVATAIAATADVYLATQNEYHVPGVLTLGTAVAASSIASSVTERLGVQYSREQEFLADECAVEILNLLRYEPTSLGVALSKMKNYCIINGNYTALFASGSHPSLNDRIDKIKDGNKPILTSIDQNYDKRMSLVNTFNAQIEYETNNFENCLKLVERNIKAALATEKDYLLLAKSKLRLFDTEKDNNEALNALNKAATINVDAPLEIPKQKAIVLKRLGRKEEAVKALDEYITQIKEIYERDEWLEYRNFLIDEIGWSKKMKLKFKNI